MRQTLLSSLAALCLVPAAAGADVRPVKPVPTVPRLKVDGELKDLAPALALKKMDGSTAAFTSRVAVTRDGLAVGVVVHDDQVTSADLLDVGLHFPEAGVIARGSTFRFAQDGQRSPPPELAAPVEAQKKVVSQVKKVDGGLSFELLIPIKAWPRFPAREPLVLELCLSYEDHDEVGQKPDLLGNCTGGSMKDFALRLPDALRTGLKLKPTARVEGLEWHAGAWLGFGGVQTFPLWVEADQKLTPESLRTLVAEQPVDPKAARIAVPAELTLPNNQPLFTVLSGSDPYAQEGSCNAEHELRLGIYRVKGKTAEQVLEWPAATCALGRATGVSMEDEGALTIGYSNGAQVHFSWSGDHYDRTEIGKR